MQITIPNTLQNYYKYQKGKEITIDNIAYKVVEVEISYPNLIVILEEVK